MIKITNRVIPMIGGKHHGYFVVDDDIGAHQISIGGEIYELRKYRIGLSLRSVWRVKGLSDDQAELMIPLDIRTESGTNTIPCV